MALSTARMHRVRGRPPLLAAGINSLIHSHSSSVRSLGYIFSLIYLFYTTPEDFSDRLLERMMLVCMDLVSGYLLFEEVAEDRSYDPWYALVQGRLAVLGGAVLYLVSDRAKALIKLAETGLECLSMP